MKEKNRIIFLEVPESLKKKVKNFSIDPAILLPVEIDNTDGIFDPETLSWEMIISGMLRVVSQDGFDINITGGAAPGISPEWLDYYRSLVLSIKPEIYHEFTNAAIVKAQNGEFEMALEINRILEGLFPRSPGVLLNKALILESRARAGEKPGSDNDALHNDNTRDEVLLAYEAALDARPVLSDTLFNAGFFFMSRRDFERAKECFSMYVSMDITEDLPPEKIKEAEKIIKDISGQGMDDPGFREAYDLINRGQDEQGLVKIRDFIERHPKVRNGWFLLGWALRKLGRFKDAMESFRKAVELGGTDIDTQNEIAICLMELGEYGSARKELEIALREDPENIKIISNLGVLALKQGKKTEAEAFFRTVLELDPRDPLASKLL